MSELYNHATVEIREAVKAASEIIGYVPERRKAVIGLLNSAQIANMTAWDPKILMSKAERSANLTWLEVIKEDSERYDAKNGTFNVFGKWYKLSEDNPEDRPMLALLERMASVTNFKDAGRRRPRVSFDYRLPQLIDIESDGSIKFTKIKNDELRKDLEDIVSDMVASGRDDIPVVLVAIAEKYKSQIEAVQQKVESAIAEVLDKEMVAVDANEVANAIPLDQTELDLIEEVYVEHREERRQNPKWDVISKVFVRRFSETYGDVGAKFVEPLLAAKNDFPKERFADIVVGGSGLQCQFGPIIKKVFPDSKLHLCDVNEHCREAAERYGEFHLCDVEELAAKFPKAPVISDAVASRQTGEGRKRATHAYLADNIHQIVLMDLGERPFVIVKLFAPFGEAVAEDGERQSVLQLLEEAKPFISYPGMSRHNTEFIAYKCKNLTKAKGAPYEALVRNSFLLEDYRHFMFQFGALPSDKFLSMQMKRVDKVPSVKKILTEVLLGSKAPVPDAQPKKKLDAFKKKPGLLPKPSPASMLSKPVTMMPPAPQTAPRARDISVDKTEDERKRQYGRTMHTLKASGMSEEKAKELAQELVYPDRQRDRPRTDMTVRTEGRKLTRPAVGASSFRPGQAMAWPKDLGEFYKYVERKGYSHEEALAYAAELSHDNSTIIDIARDYMYQKGTFTVDEVLRHLKEALGSGENDFIAFYGVCMSRSMVAKDKATGKFTLQQNVKDQLTVKRVRGGDDDSYLDYI